MTRKADMSSDIGWVKKSNSKFLTVWCLPDLIHLLWFTTWWGLNISGQLRWNLVCCQTQKNISNWISITLWDYIWQCLPEHNRCWSLIDKLQAPREKPVLRHLKVQCHWWPLNADSKKIQLTPFHSKYFSFSGDNLGQQQLLYSVNRIWFCSCTQPVEPIRFKNCSATLLLHLVYSLLSKHTLSGLSTYTWILY